MKDSDIKGNAAAWDDQAVFIDNSYAEAEPANKELQNLWEKGFGTSISFVPGINPLMLFRAEILPVHYPGGINCDRWGHPGVT